MDYHALLEATRRFIPLAIVLVGSVSLGIFSNFSLNYLLKKQRNGAGFSFLKTFYSYVKGPSYLLFIFFYLTWFSSFLNVSEAANIFRLISKIIFTATVSWLGIKLIDFAADRYLNRHLDRTATANHLAPLLPRVSLLKRTLQTLLVLLAVALLLLSFEGAKEIGKGLLLSAGVTGVVIGFAAQKLLGNLFAGYQLAFSKTLQVGDTIVVEQEYGKVEEITLTGIVVALWDQRRLVLPVSYLLEKPFLNYSYPNSEMLGVVFLYVDYEIDIEKLRQKMLSFMGESPLWDKRLAKLQVTDLTEKSLQIRVLVSAATDEQLWDLRCWVRERLMQVINQEFPGSLPKFYLSRKRSTALH